MKMVRELVVSTAGAGGQGGAPTGKEAAGLGYVQLNLPDFRIG